MKFNTCLTGVLGNEGRQYGDNGWEISSTDEICKSTASETTTHNE